ncbi:PHP domain-containing protein [Robbsia sp. Bb-Pol-6]|uniref:PHP domain-containing protein n=1 Tax=Robbsia betulipollinis TaxID=2981849 RepID=A0ABT3ZMY2_9BURK|nr:3',5'-nucleoside bisphosphate phosphatase [Robbsia betulipollinis]MCY0387880.1 PHP domain-containing protein [Robbsia betulipollinis]
MTLNADLHCHSTVSDGMLAPADVAALASRGKVDLWSLTDHDELDGQAAARDAAAALGMRYVAGVEISVTWAARTVHIVGLRIDPAHPTLVGGLERTRSGRLARARLIGERLAEVGVPGAFEGAMRYVSNPDMVSRTHFARFLVESGAARSTGDVFTRYLAEGRPGFVPHRWATLGDAMDWIHAAGGTAIVAHPGRYGFTPTEFGALFDEFKERGGTAIEVVTGSHTPDQYTQYAHVAQRYGFRASRGSDFHGLGEGRHAPGTLPPLPAGLVPVWQDW